MTPLSDGEAAILGRLADIAQKQAVTTERLVAVLDKVDGHLVRMDVDRAEAVESVKSHVDAALDKRDSWWRKFAIIIGAVTAASAALGSSLGKYFTFGPHVPK